MLLHFGLLTVMAGTGPAGWGRSWEISQSCASWAFITVLGTNRDVKVNWGLFPGKDVAGQCICDTISLAFNMADVCHELGNKSQMLGLSWPVPFSTGVKHKGKRLVVSVDMENMASTKYWKCRTAR